MSKHEQRVQPDRERLREELEQARRSIRELKAERKQHEQLAERLRESENRFRSYITDSTEALWRIEFSPPVSTELDPEQQAEQMVRSAVLADCNATFARMYGAERPQDLVGRPFIEVVQASEEDYRKFLLRYIKAGYRAFFIESRELGPSGDFRYFNNSSHSYLEDGRLISAWGSKHEITEQKLAERERRDNLHFLESLDRLHRALWQTSDLDRALERILEVVLEVFDCDRAWLLYPCDPDAASWRIPTEKTRPEYPGAFALKAEHAMDPEMAGILRRVLSEDGPLFLSMRDYRQAPDVAMKYGTKSQLSVALRPTSGQPWMLGIHQCSHEKVWNEKECLLFKEIGRRVGDTLNSLLILKQLRENETELLEAHRVARIGSWWHDLRRDEIHWSAQTYKILGIPAQQPTVELVRNLVHAEDWPILASAMEEASAGKREVEHELRIIRPDGEERWIHNRWISSYDDQGVEIMRSGTHQDITDQKRMENQLQQASRMEAIGTLAGGIAHDFNNILQSIMGFNDLARDTAPRGGETSQYLAEVAKAGVRARELVAQILAFSRPAESGIQRVPLQSVVREVHVLLRASIPSNIRIALDLDGACPPVRADLTQMYQVLMNLCTNAYQAMQKEGGVLEIGLREVRLGPGHTALSTGCAPGDYAQLTVRDTGEGMDSGTVKHIFEPFYTTKSIGKGTGLGLSIVYGTVNRLGGGITVESRPERGSAFRLYLPLADSREADGLALDVRQLGPEGRERVLLVDDELSILAHAKLGLERFGYKVDVCSSSLEALTVFQQEPERFDLVITDQIMPELSGLELAQNIRVLRGDLPVVLLTGFGEELSDEATREAGIREVLCKPVEHHALASAIRRAMEDSGEDAG